MLSIGHAENVHAYIEQTVLPNVPENAIHVALHKPSLAYGGSHALPLYRYNNAAFNYNLMYIFAIITYLLVRYIFLFLTIIFNEIYSNNYNYIIAFGTVLFI